MIRRDGYLKVPDFGIARLTAPIGIADDDLTSTRTATGTVPGVLLGTIRYMSPEQVRGEAGTPSDIFSVGLVWYELMTDRHPFARDSAVSTLHAINSVDPLRPSPLNPEVPLYVNDLLVRMLDKNPYLRPHAEDIVTGLVSGNHVPACQPSEAAAASRGTTRPLEGNPKWRPCARPQHEWDAMAGGCFASAARIASGRRRLPRCSSGIWRGTRIRQRSPVAVVRKGSPVRRHTCLSSSHSTICSISILTSPSRS
jgi:serine/threonine protein kinase